MSEVAEVTQQEAPAEAPRRTSFDSVEQAVAELERRSAERRAAKKAEKAEKAAAAEPEEAPEQQAKRDDAEDDEDDDRRRKDRRLERRAEPEDDGDDAEDESADAEDGDDDYSESDDERDEATAEDDDEPATKVVKLDGKEVEIPKGTPRVLVETVSKLAEDLKADYTRKTQEAAQAKQAAAERTKAGEELLAQVQRAQQTVLRMAQQMIGEPPSLELAQTDIQSYTIQKAIYEQRVQQLQALNQESGGLTQAQQQRAAEERQQALAEEARKMVSVMPALAKPETREKFLLSAVDAASKSGFSREDVAAVSDHRMLHLLGRLIDAETRLAALDRAGTSVSAKLKNVPPKAVKAGVASSDQGRGDKARRAKADFLRSGRTMKDVQRYLAATDR